MSPYRELVLVGTYLLIGYPYSPVLWTVSIAVFVVVDRSPTRQAPGAPLIALAALTLSQLLWVDPANPLGDAAVLLAASAGLVLPPALLAMIRQWRRQALIEERLMLAREVHDSGAVGPHRSRTPGPDAGGEGTVQRRDRRRLMMSQATTRTHVSRAMIKLHARDRAQLVVIAYRCGLADLDT